MDSMQRAAVVLLSAALAAQGDWPQWRGPSADGISQDKDIPVEWGTDRNIAWKAPLSGLGTSTPIVWGDRIFITSQLGDGPFEQGAMDFYGASLARKMGAGSKVQFLVQAFSRLTGKLLWEYKFDATGELPSVHIKHNLASPSC